MRSTKRMPTHEKAAGANGSLWKGGVIPSFGMYSFAAAISPAHCPVRICSGCHLNCASKAFMGERPKYVRQYLDFRRSGRNKYLRRPYQSFCHAHVCKHHYLHVHEQVASCHSRAVRKCRHEIYDVLYAGNFPCGDEQLCSRFELVLLPANMFTFSQTGSWKNCQR